MAKENTFWFPHDYEPTSDPKMQALIGEFGAVGYGIFWRVTEMLHSETEHKLPVKPYIFLAIAKQMAASAEQTQAVVNFAIDVCELFESDGKFFWSNRVIRNLDDRAIISQKRSKAGKEGAIAKQMLKANKQLLEANKQSVAQDRTGQDNTEHILKDWQLWGKNISDGNDQYWEQMRGRKVSSDEINSFISVAVRNNWTMTDQQSFRVSLNGFKSTNGNSVTKVNLGKIQ